MKECVGDVAHSLVIGKNDSLQLQAKASSIQLDMNHKTLKLRK
jgi:hypothetical protein